MNRCRNVQRFSAAQKARLHKAIEENRWYLSEQAGEDVGVAVAEVDFMRCHLGRVSAEFRVEYCTELCPHSDRCELAERIHELNENWSKRRLFQ